MMKVENRYAFEYSATQNLTTEVWFEGNEQMTLACQLNREERQVIYLYPDRAVEELILSEGEQTSCFDQFR